MKKLRIKMAEVAAVTAKEIPVHGAHQKKKWYNKVMKKFTPLAWREQSYDNAIEDKKEITAEDIQKLIEEKQYHYASKGLIELERKIFSGSEDPTQQQKELDSLYEKLKAEVFQVIKESLSSTDRELLQQAIQAIVEQETQDSQYSPENGNQSRPRGWMQAWKECIKQTVEDRLNDLLQEEKPKGPPSIISILTAIALLFKKDLIHVVTHLMACYPEEFDVCNTYAQHYHHNMKTQIEHIVQFEILEKDNYLLLCWVQNLYPNEILKNPMLAGHIDDSRLGNLLHPNKIRHLEKDYLIYEADSVLAQMNKALDLEEEVWKTEKEPKLLGPHYHSELHIDLIQCYTGAFKRASEIRPEVMDRLAPILANQLKDILRRYKKLFGEYIEKNRNRIFYRATCITHLNCCLALRQFLTCKESRFREGERLDMVSLLLQLEDSIYDDLLQDLFVDLKAKFKKMSQGSSPFSYQTMQAIIRACEDFMDPFHTLMDESYKVLSGKIHLYLVKEHLSRILKRKVNYKTVQQMQTLARQINENAELINLFSVSYNSGEDWLKGALSKLAEIIRLQDLNAIQLEVATLVEAYPDIQNKQIEAILYMKGNLSRNEVKLILKTADTVERRVNEKQKLFDLIKTSGSGEHLSTIKDFYAAVYK